MIVQLKLSILIMVVVSQGFTSDKTAYSYTHTHTYRSVLVKSEYVVRIVSMSVF